MYPTLDRLAVKGVIHSVRVASLTQYVAIAPAELLLRLREDFAEPLDYLEKTLPALATFEPPAEVLTVTGLEAIRESARSIVLDARAELYLSLWSDDLEHLRGDLAAAKDRDVRIFAMLYGEAPVPAGGSWLSHGYREIVSDRIGGRMLTLVNDADEALVAHIPRSGGATGVRTRNPVLALVAREYLHHDLVLQRAQAAIGFDEWDRWWQADPDLRTLILSGHSADGPRRGRRPAPKASRRAG